MRGRIFVRSWRSRLPVALACLALAVAPARLPAKEKGMSLEELAAMPKIDAHAHIMSLDSADEAAFRRALEKDNITWLTLCTAGTDSAALFSQIRTAARLHAAMPKQVAWATSFNLQNWGAPDWESTAIATLAEGFKQGAVGVKVWKDIGMVLYDPKGKFVLVDDPRFDPVFDYIAGQGKTLVAHIAEPRSCWLPLDRMESPNDRKYYEEHPQYHAFLHQEIPNYWELIGARDHMLEKHPNLRVVGCHLGSLEFDVDEIASRFDRYPNFAVDLAERVYYFQMQNREKVKRFVIRYQDRILYGTDLVVGQFEGRAPSIAQSIAHMDSVYAGDYRYFATDDQLTDWKVPKPFQGLDLPAEVLKKIFYENAEKWYPGIRGGAPR